MVKDFRPEDRLDVDGVFIISIEQSGLDVILGLSDGGTVLMEGVADFFPVPPPPAAIAALPAILGFDLLA